MTKDRRLGKGLAALLGTAIEETPTGKSSAGKDSQGVATQQRRNAGSSQPSAGAARESNSKQKPAVRSLPLNEDSEAQPPFTQTGSLHINVAEIDNNPFQPRREFNDEEISALAESLRQHEQLQPILVRRVGERYQLISGERRLRATVHAGLTQIRAEVREADDRLVAELAIVENLQRKDLNPIEKAFSFRRYIEQHACTQEDLAKRLKIDRSTIANLMRLLELPDEIQVWIGEGKLTAGHARALLPLGEEEQQQAFAQDIIAHSWSVREVERRVAEVLEAEDAPFGSTKPPSNRSRISPQVAALEQQLRLALGTKTEIRQNAKGRGKISISFANAEEFDRILHLICPSLDRKAA